MVDEWKARPDRPIAVPLLHVRPAEQLERLRAEATWRTSGRDAITLTKEPGLRLVLLLLGKGTRIPEHQAAGPLTLHVLSGSMMFRAGGRRAHRARGGHRARRRSPGGELMSPDPGRGRPGERRRCQVNSRSAIT